VAADCGRRVPAASQVLFCDTVTAVVFAVSAALLLQCAVPCCVFLTTPSGAI
jgi:hypothetical protein